MSQLAPTDEDHRRWVEHVRQFDDAEFCRGAAEALIIEIFRAKLADLTRAERAGEPVDVELLQDCGAWLCELLDLPNDACACYAIETGIKQGLAAERLALN